MPKKIKIPKFADIRGSLASIDNLIHFKIKRVYYLYSLKKNVSRGKHSHIKNKQFFVCLNGKVEVKFKNRKFILSKPNFGLLVKPEEWHEIIPKLDYTIILVLASEHYDKKDYIYN